MSEANEEAPNGTPKGLPEDILAELEAMTLPETKPLPGEMVLRAPKGVLPAARAGTVHGANSFEAIEIPTSLTCSTCPLYFVKRKDRRHRLACPEERKNRICPILMRRQMTWVAELVQEFREATGVEPSASDRARIEQIVRHRSRIFQIENYIRVAGLIDLKTGQYRNVADKLTTTENALSRSLGEFRQAMAEKRDQTPAAPRLEEYLAVKENERGESGKE